MKLNKALHVRYNVVIQRHTFTFEKIVALTMKSIQKFVFYTNPNPKYKTDHYLIYFNYSIVRTFVTSPLFPKENPGKPRKTTIKVCLFSGHSSLKSEFTRLFRTFPGFSVGKRGEVLVRTILCVMFFY